MKTQDEIRAKLTEIQDLREGGTDYAMGTLDGSCNVLGWALGDIETLLVEEI